MTADFQHRLVQAARLETPFIETFNEVCQTHRIFKFGIESTELRNLHQYIRSASDDTSHFIRYLPDSALVRTDGTTPHTSLLEFKVSDSLVQTDSLLGRIQQEHQRLNEGIPPIQDKQDIFGMEKASLDFYQRLADVGVRVVVIAWQTKRTQDTDTIRAQYADRVVTCQVQEPSPALRARGSGTVISNVHFGEFVAAQDFFEREFGIAQVTLAAVAAGVRAR